MCVLEWGCVVPKNRPQKGAYGALEDRNESHEWAEVCGKLGGSGVQWALKLGPCFFAYINYHREDIF